MAGTQTSLSVQWKGGATAICLLQQTTATAYDGDGNVHGPYDRRDGRRDRRLLQLLGPGPRRLSRPGQPFRHPKHGRGRHAHEARVRRRSGESEVLPYSSEVNGKPAYVSGVTDVECNSASYYVINDGKSIFGGSSSQLTGSYSLGSRQVRPPPSAR